ncbi:MAG: ATP-binding protein [Planctomycetota bacterium]
MVDDADTMRERVASTVAGILGLLGIDADPVRSQEHVLLSTILDKAWREGRDLDFASLIGEIQSPPFETIGVLDLDSVMPAKKRFELAMAVNTLLASPTFSAWTHGEPMDINSLLYTTEGKPRVSILSISHLAESERMFFVTLLLNEVVSWVRSQSGTTSLRAIIYMDEVFGFFPPVAEPPSKRPMLTLLKQARAYGVGCVLATQNPVDLDYKGLSNAGTWFLGRLQTERDLKRVLDGLEGATANAGQAFDRDTVERTLAGLKSRVFLMNNVHNDGPSLFHTRWAMSYLRGPMTRDHIKTLMADRVAKADDPVEDDPETPDIDESETASVEQDETNAPPGTSASRPPVPPDIELRYLHANRHLSPSESLVYKPAVLGVAPLHFVRVAAKIDEWHDATFVARVPEREITIWPDATATTLAVSELDEEPDTDAFYESFPAWAVSPKQEAEWQRDLKAHAYRELARPVWHCKEAKTYSELGEDRDHFLGRATRVLSEELAQDIEKLEDRQRSKLDAIDERIRKAEQRVEVERDQWRAAGADSAVSFGAAILNKLFGGRKKISTSVRKAGRAMQQRSDIARAEENVEALVNQRREMQEEFSQELDELRSTKIAPEITEITVRPRKSDLVPQPLTIVWLPYAWTREREEALYTFREASNS